MSRPDISDRLLDDAHNKQFANLRHEAATEILKLRDHIAELEAEVAELEAEVERLDDFYP